jgi:hypothetical protein
MVNHTGQSPRGVAIVRTDTRQALRDHDAALSMGVDVALGTHTVTVFADGPHLFVRDPARRGFHAISGLQDICKLVDSVL